MQLHHPHVIECYGYTEVNGELYLLFEYATLGSLDKYLESKKPGFSELLELCCQLCDALALLHENNIVHRELAADNILVSEGPKIKLGDFGKF